MKVSVVKCDSYENKRVREALEKSLKNIGFKFRKNMKVLIKPNVLSPTPPEKAVTTHPVILEELCRILKKEGVKIFVGESSSYSTGEAFEVSGISKLNKYAEVVNFEGCEKEFFDFPSVRNVPLPKILFDVDLVINVAKLKTHVFTGVTLCVKNLYGCVPGRIKSVYHKKLPSAKKFSKFLLELHDKIKPGLNIIDGIVGLEGLGPGTAGTPVNSGVVVSGTNAVATDVIASEIMGFEPYSIYTNEFSRLNQGSISVVGDKVSLNFQKPSGTYLFLTPFFHQINNFFPRSKITFDYSKCFKCGVCERNCPVGAISLSPYPVCDHKKCIKCGCCVETCPNAAVGFRDNLIKILAKKIYYGILKV